MGRGSYLGGHTVIGPFKVSFTKPKKNNGNDENWQHVYVDDPLRGKLNSDGSRLIRKSAIEAAADRRQKRLKKSAALNMEAADRRKMRLKENADLPKKNAKLFKTKRRKKKL